MALILTGLALGLASCSGSKSTATTTDAAAPAPKKLLSRSAQMYAGQEQILDVDSATVALGKTPDTLELTASGKTSAPGYTELAFLPRINPGPPADGIYDVDVIGYKPQGVAAQVVTPVEVKGQWDNYPKTELKGVRFVTKTKEVVAMLPAQG
jgi:hypothetical protein